MRVHAVIASPREDDILCYYADVPPPPASLRVAAGAVLRASR